MNPADPTSAEELATTKELVRQARARGSVDRSGGLLSLYARGWQCGR
jgi:hypothetical protein